MAIRRYGRFSLESLQNLDAATIDDLWLGAELVKYVSPGILRQGQVPVQLLEESPVFVDLGAGRNFELTLTDNRVIGSPLDQMPGRNGYITIRQNDVGGFAATWHADWKPVEGESPSLRTGAGEATTFRYRVIDVGNVALEKEPDSASVSEIFSGTVKDKYISPFNAFETMADVTLVDGPSIVPNLNAGLTFELTIEDDRQISNPTGQRRGKKGRFYIQQGTAGNKNVTWGSDFKFVGGVVPVIPAAPGDWTIVPYDVRSPGNILALAVDPSPSSGSGDAIAASVAEVRSAAAVSKYVSPSTLVSRLTPYTLPNAASVLPDMNLGVNFVLTLQQNCLIQNMANQRPGDGGDFIIIQGGAGTYSATWDTNYNFTGGVPVVPQTVGAWTLVRYVVQALGVIRCQTIQTGEIPQAATVADVWAGNSSTKFLTPSIIRASRVIVTLVDEAVILVNLDAGANFRVTLAGNRAMNNPINQAAGKEGVFKVIQDEIGGRLLTWGDNYIFEDDPPVLPTDPGKHLVIPYHVEEPGIVLVG